MNDLGDNPDTGQDPEAERGPEAEQGPEAQAAVDGEAGSSEIVEQVRIALRGVSDPELGLSIVDLGLVYDIEIEGELARVTMTLTSPGCPAGGQIMGDAKRAAESVEGVSEAAVELVWKPFWTPDRIDPQVRAMMGF
jgi:metal-sulfur cluster biosynthetic enzyme